MIDQKKRHHVFHVELSVHEKEKDNSDKKKQNAEEEIFQGQRVGQWGQQQCIQTADVTGRVWRQFYWRQHHVFSWQRRPLRWKHYDEAVEKHWAQKTEKGAGYF